MALSLEKYAKVVNQKGTSSCVANAVAGALKIMEEKSEYAYGYPSRLFLYWYARRKHGRPPLRDDGTYIRSCCKALREGGVPDEKYWRFRALKVNKKPAGLQPYMMADPRKGGEYLRIKERGDARLASLRSAIAEGYPVVFGTALAKSFLSATGPHTIDKPDLSERLIGNHAMCIVGYSADGKFRVLNSWGTNWRDGGFCWMTGEYLRWSQSDEFTIIRGWKRIRGDK